MLTRAQIEEYNEVGAIVVPDVLTPDEVRTLSDVTDGFVERARGLTGHTEIYDLEDSPHSPTTRGSVASRPLICTTRPTPR